jgi:Nucleotidyltransferase domain
MDAATIQQDPMLAEIVRSLIEAYQPERIYLFGSLARGEGGPDSDYDLMVVVPDDAPHRDTAADWPIRCCAGPAERPTFWYASAASSTAGFTYAPRFRRPSPPKAGSYTPRDHASRAGPRGRSPGLGRQGRACLRAAEHDFHAVPFPGCPPRSNNLAETDRLPLRGISSLWRMSECKT